MSQLVRPTTTFRTLKATAERPSAALSCSARDDCGIPCKRRRSASIWRFSRGALVVIRHAKWAGSPHGCARIAAQYGLSERIDAPRSGDGAITLRAARGSKTVTLTTSYGAPCERARSRPRCRQLVPAVVESPLHKAIERPKRAQQGYPPAAVGDNGRGELKDSPQRPTSPLGES